MPSRDNITKRNQLYYLFKFLSDYSDINQLSSEVVDIIKSVRSKLESLTDEWSVIIGQIEIPISDKKLKRHNPSILIGGMAKGKKDEIYYQSLSLCISFISRNDPISYSSPVNVDSCCLKRYGDGNWRRIVRRFHFDYQPQDSIKPISHLQYGGEFKHEQHLGPCHYCLEHFLEGPRIHFPPMDLVLLFDLILREFETPLNKMIEEQYWRWLVRRSQKIWWNNYSRNLGKYISQNSGPTFHDYLYGKTE